MIFLNPAKDFYIQAARYAKNQQTKTINELEADIMMLEHNLFSMMDEGASKQKISLILNQVSELKEAIKEKKKKI